MLAKKNILASFFIKGLSVAISLILLPLTISYVNPTQYGIWLTLSSIVAWFSFFDIGLTQGLRNKFAEAKATGQKELAQIYISTTYAILTIVFGVVWLLFLIVNNFLDWSNLLSIPEKLQHEISILAVIIFTYFCFQFVLKIINTLLIADQRPAKAGLIDLVGQIASLIFIVILTKTTQGSLIYLGIALCLAPILVLMISNIYLFKGEYEVYKPSFKKVRFKYAKSLFNLGIVFFIIQVAGIIQFQTANIIIIKNFGASNVTAYNIVFKYFGILNMIYAIFLTPFWSASTEAFLKNEISWIKNSMKKYSFINYSLFAISILMLLFSNFIYDFWIGKDKVHIDFWLTFWGFMFINFSMFVGKYSSFLNGISALRLQFISCIISPFIYIAAAILLIKIFHLGIYSIYIAAILANFNGFILAPLQYYMIIEKNKKGIWIK